MQVSKIKLIRGYPTELRNLYISFLTYHTIYRHSCELLLGPLMLPNSKMFELLEGGDEKAWQDLGIHENLKNRLGPDYDIYVSSVEMLNRKLVEFGKELGLDKDKTVRIL